ncbi:MAG: hypothetical protein HYV90_01335 [Candidatus Woesebacteria bacterium]|nr:MAG: hypothetical protein HYV90_01335 [Candidatus Woesebacteria bacterium]
MPERSQTKENEGPVTKRVIIEHEDGTISYLEGDDVQKWESVMSGLVTLGFAHGKQGQAELKSLEWKSAANLQELEAKTP